MCKKYNIVITHEELDWLTAGLSWLINEMCFDSEEEEKISKFQDVLEALTK